MASQEQGVDNEIYDFILVGAGTAACLLASRLSKQLPNHRILALEAGEHIQNDPKISTPGLSMSLQSDPKYDWQYTSQPEPGLNNHTVAHPRGKLVGGTSAINSHSVVFPNQEWQDRIAEELLSGPGREEWNAKNMEDCYTRWQAVVGEDVVNDDGRVRTSFPRELDLLQTQWLKVFEELGYATGSTGFGKSNPGAVTVTNAVDSSKGERSHAGTAFMESALKRDNVVLRTGVKVDRIVFGDDSARCGMLEARGVKYVQGGKECISKAREVILCAGVFGSPAILERSGIGQKRTLDEAKIPLLYELPGVGENLQDHLNCSMSIETQDHVPTRDYVLRDPEARKVAMQEYQEGRKGRLSEGPAYSFSFPPLQMLETEEETQELVNTVEKHMRSEDSQTLTAQYSFLKKIIESPVETTGTTLMVRIQRHKDLDSLPKGTPEAVDGNYVTLIAMLAHPFSRGSCHVTSVDPSQKPEIKFNYLSHPLDTEILARHLRLIERLFQQPAFKVITKPDGRRLPRSHPFPITSLEDAKAILPINSATNYHPCGTCAMMSEDLGGVVDEKLRVYGTTNVRVCDASILPIIPRGNILTAVYAFAEKGAEIIVQDINGMH